MRETTSGSPETRRYDANYGNFELDLYRDIRREAYGDEFGQNSWLTADEFRRFLDWLELSPNSQLLDIACGAGGPAMRAAEVSGCQITGIDLHETAIVAANRSAIERGISDRAKFKVINAGEPLPFSDATFDAILCIDAINHIPDRHCVLNDWQRILKQNRRILFTDPIVVTGPLTDAEMKIRSRSGFYIFVPEGYNERVLGENGFLVLRKEDLTQNMAEIAERRRAARASRETELRRIEGDSGYEDQQEFLTIAALTASEKRLSRFAFLAEKRN